MADQLHARPTSFLDLPSEIRNVIYELALTCKDLHFPPGVLAGCPARKCDCFGRALFYVSPRVRHEAQSIFFGRHNLHFTLVPKRQAFLRAWVDFQDDEAIAAIGRLSMMTYRRRTWAEVFLIDLSQDSPNVEIRTKERWKMERRQPILEILQRLPRSKGKVVLTKAALWEVFDAVGWYPNCSPFIGGERYSKKLNA